MIDLVLVLSIFLVVLFIALLIASNVISITTQTTREGVATNSAQVSMAAVESVVSGAIAPSTMNGASIKNDCYDYAGNLVSSSVTTPFIPDTASGFNNPPVATSGPYTSTNFAINADTSNAAAGGWSLTMCSVIPAYGTQTAYTYHVYIPSTGCNSLGVCVLKVDQLSSTPGSPSKETVDADVLCRICVDETTPYANITMPFTYLCHATKSPCNASTTSLVGNALTSTTTMQLVSTSFSVVDTVKIQLLFLSNANTTLPLGTSPPGTILTDSVLITSALPTAT